MIFPAILKQSWSLHSEDSWKFVDFCRKQGWQKRRCNLKRCVYFFSRGDGDMNVELPFHISSLNLTIRPPENGWETIASFWGPAKPSWKVFEVQGFWMKKIPQSRFILRMVNRRYIIYPVAKRDQIYHSGWWTWFQIYIGKPENSFSLSLFAGPSFCRKWYFRQSLEARKKNRLGS